MSDQNTVDLFEQVFSVCEDVIAVNSESISDEDDKQKCQMLTISLDLSIDELFQVISSLDQVEYPRLFVFIVNNQNFNLIDENNKNRTKIMNLLLNFCKVRPMILHLNSEEEEITEIFYKSEGSSQFHLIHADNVNAEHNFGSFCDSMFGDIDLFLSNVQSHQDSSLIIRFVNFFDSSYIIKLIIASAETGTINDLLAAVDAPFNSHNRICDLRSAEYLSKTFLEDIEEDEETNDDDNDEDSKAPELSILLMSIKSQNNEITTFLMEKCTALIKALPFEHQVEISDLAFSTGQFRVLCELIEQLDFPFPKNIARDQIPDPQLLQLYENRVKLFENIEEQKVDEISKFIGENKRVKLIYNPDNISASDHAANNNYYKSFYRFKSYGIRSEYESNIIMDKMVMEIAKNERNHNVENSLKCKEKSVMLLLSRLYIHEENIKGEITNVNFKKIMQWFKDIYESGIGSDLFDVAAQNHKRLNIMFDFTKDKFETKDLISQKLKLNMQKSQNFIFIAAKFCNSEYREDEIKQLIIIEIWCFVLKVVYENHDLPFYKEDNERKEMFKKILNDYRLSQPVNERIYDDNETKTRELIRKFPQIIKQFNQNEKPNYEFDYISIIDYYQNHVLPELKNNNFNLRKDIKNFNKIAKDFKSFLLGLEERSITKNINDLINKESLVIVLSNMPELCFLNIHQHLSQTQGTLFDAKNIFITAESLKKPQEILDLLKSNLLLKPVLQTVNRATRKFLELIANQETKPLIIVKNEKNRNSIKNFLKDKNLSFIDKNVSYDWNDLNIQTKMKLLQTKINFQNNLNHSLFDLILKENESIGDQDLSQIIDDDFLQLLLSKENIKVNSKIEISAESDFIDSLYHEREFIVNKIELEEPKLSNDHPLDNLNESTASNHSFEDQFASTKITEIIKFNNVIDQPFSHDFPKPNIDTNLDQLLEITKHSKYVLMSDVAGSGKTWMLRNLVKKLQIHNSKLWINYVDLKDHIEEFNKIQDSSEESQDQIEFSSFMTAKILQFTNYEAKIFNKMYENGKVFIIFDGFDEISPEYKEVVVKIMQSFKYNNGNQLWISTRSFYKDYLKLHLNVNFCIEFKPLLNEEVLDVMLANLFNDFIKESKDKIPNTDNFYSTANNSYNRTIKFDEYKKIGDNLKQKLFLAYNKTQNLVLFSLVAEVLKEQNKLDSILQIIPNLIETYNELTDKLCEIWSHDKGSIRKATSLKYKTDSMNFHEVHQIIAMMTLFPLSTTFCGIKIKWTDEEIIGCGLVNIKDGKFEFICESLRDFYAADFLIRQLKKFRKDFHDDLVVYLVKFVTIIDYKLIRKFSNEYFNESLIQLRLNTFFDRIVEIISQNFNKELKLTLIHEENLQNLIKFFTKVVDKIQTDQKNKNDML